MQIVDFQLHLESNQVVLNGMYGKNMLRFSRGRAQNMQHLEKMQEYFCKTHICLGLLQ